MKLYPLEVWLILCIILGSNTSALRLYCKHSLYQGSFFPANSSGDGVMAEIVKPVLGIFAFKPYSGYPDERYNIQNSFFTALSMGAGVQGMRELTAVFKIHVSISVSLPVKWLFIYLCGQSICLSFSACFVLSFFSRWAVNVPGKSSVMTVCNVNIHSRAHTSCCHRKLLQMLHIHLYW